MLPPPMSPPEPDTLPRVPGRVTVVVPTRNSQRTLQACLRSARAQNDADVEIVVVDNRSTDDTVAIARAHADVVETWGPERSAQRNRGAALGSGEHVLFIDSDQTLTSRVAAEVVVAFAANSAIGGLVVPEFAHGEGFFAASRTLEKRLYLGDETVEAARAFRWSALVEVGGYDEDLTGAEDWDLPDRIRAAGHGLSRIDAPVWHDEGRVRLGTTFAKKRYYGRGMPRYRSKPTARPIARTSLLRQPMVLARSPVRTGGLVVLKAVEAAGIALGAYEASRPGAE